MSTLKCPRGKTLYLFFCHTSNTDLLRGRVLYATVVRPERSNSLICARVSRKTCVCLSCSRPPKPSLFCLRMTLAPNEKRIQCTLYRYQSCHSPAASQPLTDRPNRAFGVQIQCSIRTSDDKRREPLCGATEGTIQNARRVRPEQEQNQTAMITTVWHRMRPPNQRHTTQPPWPSSWWLLS